MAKRQKIGLLILLIGIFAVSPFFAGLWFEYQYKKAIRHFNTTSQVHVVIQSYKRHWLYSAAVLDIEAPLAIVNFLIPSIHVFSNNEKIKLKLAQYIAHGPFFFPHPDNFRHFLGLAVIHNQWVLGQGSAEVLQDKDFIHLTMNKNNIYVSMLANYLIDLQLEKIQLQDLRARTMLRLATMHLETWFMPRSERIQGHLQIQNLEIKNEDSQWIVPDVNLAFDQQMADLTLWTGHLDSSVNGIMWREGNEDIFSLADAHFRSETRKSNNFVALDRNIEIGKIQFNDQTIGPLSLQLNAEKLNATAISDMLMAYKLIMQRGELYKNQLRQKIFLILPDIIYPGANLNLKKLSLMTPYGQIQASGKIFWPTNYSASPDTLSDFIQEVPVNISLAISAPLVKTLINMTAKSPYLNPYTLEERSKILKLESDIDSAFQWNKRFLAWMSENQIISEDAETALLLNSSDPDFAEYYLYQIKQLFLSREISAYMAYLLYFYYGGFMFYANTIDGLINKHINDSKALMLNTLNKAISNGQINDFNGHYTTVITRENEEIKLNGKIFSY